MSHAIDVKIPPKPRRLGHGLAPLALAALSGLAWLAGGDTLCGPLACLGLPAAIALAGSRRLAGLSAFIYYLAGSVSIPGAVAGYYGMGHDVLGLIAWLGASAALAGPWALAWRSLTGTVAALAITALPPLGVIGWLSPLNAAGVLFPGTGWVGLLATTAGVAMLCAAAIRSTTAYSCIQRTVALHKLCFLGGIGVVSANLMALAAGPAQTPAGWIGVQTTLMPAQNDVARAITVRQALIDAALRQGREARVLIFPEALLDDWLPGTQAQLAAAVPAGQTWLIGAQTGTQAGASNAVVLVQAGFAQTAPLTRAAGLLLAGNWRPWDRRTLHPAWWQTAYEVDGRRVWSALCIEQLQPWTWIEALAQRPDVILAQSNTWWAPTGSFAPAIQAASTRAWARLMGVPVVMAVNQK